MIQIPRLFEIYKANKLLNSFQDMLSNIFQPIFEATLDPQSHPKIFKFLQLNDESVLEIIDYKTKPQDWDHSENPSYAVYAYYIYANVSSLNRLRKSRGLNTFSFRPHSGFI
ncbi:hypothetical protein MHBO_003870 [Bonamia ostreae]|uniref:Uncharacterized protein n=1 Tax=Bonamia ostreae TaxID=126728 RepID=A0ABV2ARS5_9EUKA